MRAAGPDTYESVRAAYLSALVEHDEVRARQTIEGALEAGADVRDLYVLVLQPVLYEVGERWADGRLSVADEHNASAITRRVLTLLGEQMRRPARDGRLAVVACSPGELHELGAQMIADFLESEGWEALRLGASLPAEDLAGLVASERPDVVAVSTAMPERLEGAADMLVALAGVRPRPLVVVGGQGWRGEHAARATELGADLLVEDAATLVEVLSTRFPSPGDV